MRRWTNWYWSLLDINRAALHELELKRGTRSNAFTLVTKCNISRTIYMQVISSRNPSANFPFDSPINLDVHHHHAGIQVLAQRLRHERRHRHGVTVQKRGPNDDVLVALVGRGEQCGKTYLLVSVGSVDISFLVVDSDFVVWVSRRDRDL